MGDLCKQQGARAIAHLKNEALIYIYIYIYIYYIYKYIIIK